MQSEIERNHHESTWIIEEHWGSEHGGLCGAVVKLKQFVLEIGDEEAICLCSAQSSYQGFVCGTT